MKLAAGILTSGAIAAVFVLALRAGIGPFALAGVRIASPIGLETAFGCALVALLFIQPPAKFAEPKYAAPLVAALALIALVYAPNLKDPFLSDDYILAARATHDPPE